MIPDDARSNQAYRTMAEANKVIARNQAEASRRLNLAIVALAVAMVGNVLMFVGLMLR